MLSLPEIKNRIEQLAKQIDAPANLIPSYGTSKNIGDPFIDVDDSHYYYLALERDVKTINRQTSNFDELLYWVFQYITSTMALYYELNHRDPNSMNDFRRVKFAYQLELLEKLSPMWRKRREQEIEDMLKDHPYRK